MKTAPAPNARVLVTGATGFVGKVVLEELLRRRAELGLAGVTLLIRPRRGEAARSRFEKEIASSECFSQLPAGWQSLCDVVEGDLSEPGAGLNDLGRMAVTSHITHIIHCAASVEFDLPLAEAANANITSSLNVMELARNCKHLLSMVSVSTAYVTPHKFDGKPVEEELVKLPFSPAAIYQSILAGTADEKALLAQTGHPNTYTFTKCIAEHMLFENKGSVPLTIVRPSIVAACWQYPFPGWIDSYAGFAGFAAAIGLGRMKAVVADPQIAIDVVPCDEVAARSIDAAFSPATKLVRYAVAGVANACRVDESCNAITAFFQDHPVGPVAELFHIGANDAHFRMHDMVHHQGPGRALAAWYKLTGKDKLAKRTSKFLDRLDYLNREFPYFTGRTFDFRPSVPLRLSGFSTKRYVRLICRGIARHMLKLDETRLPIGGARHDAGEMDLEWSARKPNGNAVIRSMAYAARKTLRLGAEEVTFDRESFEDALAQVPAGSRFIIVPSHRSYLDFILCSYLFFSHPDLGVRIPHIAAADDFSNIALVGRILEEAHAFYLARGKGREDLELSQRVKTLVEQGETIQFFIEGARSRSGRFLPPKRGLLRCLQSTGEKFVILPVAVSYDRVPEESALLRELHGGPKPAMKLRKLVRWAGELAMGKVSLGRIHLSCGEPLTLDSATDVPELSRRIVGELQNRIAPTTRHLQAFLARAGLNDIDLPWLRSEIERRGGEVIESGKGEAAEISPSAELWMRWHYIHWFYADAQKLWPGHPAIAAHVARHDYLGAGEAPAVESHSDPRETRLVRALFGTIVRDYELAVRMVGTPDGKTPTYASPLSVWEAVPSASMPCIQDAYDDLMEREILAKGERGSYQWGPKASEILALRKALHLDGAETTEKRPGWAVVA